MADIPRLNPAIRALETGNPAFVTFSPPEIGAAQSIAAAPYDGVVFEMEHNPTTSALCATACNTCSTVRRS